MRIKKDGHLVEPLDPDVDAKSQKIPKKKQMGSEQPSHQKHPRSESDPKDGNEGNIPSAVVTSQKGKEKATKSSHRGYRRGYTGRGKKNVEDRDDGLSS
ncbi:hypothetical protein R1flu_008258 [Riccia fluitans]|uniref:Uncharacterized protein n=1 Tax=Riccia fluitans TaxID=41844 RepID=A0ABD1YB62_9MARC